jgi:hypothetical protein
VTTRCISVPACPSNKSRAIGYIFILSRLISDGNSVPHCVPRIIRTCGVVVPDADTHIYIIHIQNLLLLLILRFGLDYLVIFQASRFSGTHYIHLVISISQDLRFCLLKS